MRTYLFNPFPNTGEPFYRTFYPFLLIFIGSASKRVEWYFDPYTSFENQKAAIPLPSDSPIDVSVTTVYDALTRIHSDVVDDKLRSIGFLPSIAAVGVYERMREVHSILYRLLLNPSFELCSVVHSYTRLLKNNYSIGVQIRMGGNMSNTMDCTFMNMTRVMGVLNEVRRLLSLKNESNAVLFVSVDTPSIVDFFQESLNSIRIISVKEYSIGHSATVYGNWGNKQQWEQATKRAIIDLMILKECDHLITTSGSSYGDLATELQQSYGLQVTLEPFLKEKGLKCSVYNRRKGVGVYNKL